jgi:non-heme chloroperoxidase
VLDQRRARLWPPSGWRRTRRAVLAINIATTRAFLHDCFSIQPTQEEYETMLAFNMMVPPKVRLGPNGRPLDVDDMLHGLKLPVLVTQGAEDKNSNLMAAEYTAKMIPGAKLSIYQSVGHSPFFEATQRRTCRLRAQRPERELTSPFHSPKATPTAVQPIRR